MFKKSDYAILAVICFFFGIFVMAQYYSAKEYKSITQPQNNEVIALEVAKLTKTNADLRTEVQKLTSDLDTYRNSSESRKNAYEKYLIDLTRYDTINGVKEKKGQGVKISIDGQLNLSQVIDLVNALKNIGAELISVNDTRIVINSNLTAFSGLGSCEVKAIGNSVIIKSAMERRGGIIEQIANNNLIINVAESDDLVIPTGDAINFKYAKIIED